MCAEFSEFVEVFLVADQLPAAVASPCASEEEQRQVAAIHISRQSDLPTSDQIKVQLRKPVALDEFF